MSFIDILSFSLSLLGIYSLILYLRYLLPRYNIPSVSTFLGETKQLLGHAEEICAIQPENEYRAHLYLYDNHIFMFTFRTHFSYSRRSSLANQFATMRIENNHARGIFQQLHIAILHGLTCRLHALYYRIDAIKLKLEVRCLVLLGYHITKLIMAPQLMVDERQISMMESAAGTVVPPAPAASTCQPRCKCEGYLPVMVPSVTAIPMTNVIEPTLPLPATAI